jgi:hypothetical protein
MNSSFPLVNKVSSFLFYGAKLEFLLDRAAPSFIVTKSLLVRFSENGGLGTCGLPGGFPIAKLFLLLTNPNSAPTLLGKFFNTELLPEIDLPLDVHSPFPSS